MSNLKLGVEVVSAHNLNQKDRKDVSSAFVEIRFDDHKFHTSIKEKDLDPVWNETFYINIPDPNHLPKLILEARVLCNNKTGRSISLGKVCITGRSFVPYPDAAVLHYPLEKMGIFTHAPSGELGLKVFITDDPSIRPSSPTMDFPPHMSSHSYGKKVSKHIFPRLHNIMREQEPHSSCVEPHDPKLDLVYSGSSSQPVEHMLKQTSPIIGGGRVLGRDRRVTTTYDLVERMEFLFVRIVKARDLSSKDFSATGDPCVEVRVGNYKGITKHIEKSQSPEWNKVFAFAKERMESSVLDVVLKDTNMVKDDFVGIVRFDLCKIPTRVPPDSPLATEWYSLENRKGKKKRGELMLAVWIGTQADEAFPDAWHTNAASIIDASLPSTHIHSKVYHSPRLWYVRVNVIEVQDLVTDGKTRFPDVVYVKAQIGSQVLKTQPVTSQTMNAQWNEDLMLIAAEPFEEQLILSVEERMSSKKDEMLGQAIIPLDTVEKRVDDRFVQSRWYNLHKSRGSNMELMFSTTIHLCITLDGGYHMLGESSNCSSDLRPTAKQLWKPSIGVLDLGILNAHGLYPMNTRGGRGTSDTYCVAKYGHKWIRTRTIVGSLTPKYNEQYTWEVYDPATVLTVGVFDNGQLEENSSNPKNDMKIGKVCIRISTLETNRVYTHSYPLIVLHPSGVKKMGELHLAIRFSCTSMFDMMYLYSTPLLPKMHYVKPLPIAQREILHHEALNIVASRLSRAEPPLRKEVVEYMSNADSHQWSMRRSKANFYRLISAMSGLFSAAKWFEDVCMWKNPVMTGLVHILLIVLVCFPQLILSTVFLYMLVVGLWNYRYRPQYPPHLNTRISFADSAHIDELDEEFDTFPTSRSPEQVRMRYDRLRSVAGQILTVAGDVATHGERVEALLSWRDPRSTTIFIIFCLAVAIVFYVTPFQLFALMAGLYIMRHPKFRHGLPPVPLSFFCRLPSKTDSML